jgi:ABC-type bacteriocin/lantibiotic exporter with double-glycine peptidase domain
MLNFQGYYLISRLWKYISPRRRAQFIYLLVLMIIGSFSEILSIGSALPFLGALASPKNIYTNQYLNPIFLKLGFFDPSDILIPLTIVFAGLVVFSSLVRLVLIWANAKLSYVTGSDLSSMIYRLTLEQPYKFHISRNTSEVITAITSRTTIVTIVINAFLTIISTSVILAFVTIAFVLLSPKMAFFIIGSIIILYLAVVSLTKKKLDANGEDIEITSVQVVKIIQEGLGGIRDIIIDGSQDIYCKNFQKQDSRLKNAQSNNLFIGQSPRYIMEAFGIVAIAVITCNLVSDDNGILVALPFVGGLALGIQRLLPLVQHCYSAWSVIKGNKASLLDTINYIELTSNNSSCKSLKITNSIDFKREINFDNVFFKYSDDGPFILKGMSFSIKKGSCIGLIGSTGSGKSTCLDLIMGLLTPSSGFISVDDYELCEKDLQIWRSNISHVPQTIYLSDASVEQNIAFGIPENLIDHDRVLFAANKAQISETIESWDAKYKTIVGERGVRLSGGQRQRIAIARALYKQSSVIVFDEATSALDYQTEDAIMKTIGNLSKEITVIIVAHRLNSLKECEKIIEIENGAVKRIGSYKEVVEKISK